MIQPVSLWLKTHYRFTWWTVFLLSLLPFALLIQRYFSDTLGINPLQALEQETGKLTLIFLILSLTITPVRRLMAFICQQVEARYGKRISDWNWIIRLRRMLGLFSLFYAFLHLLTWLHFELAWDTHWILEEVLEKPYLSVGAIVFIILLILGVTSPRFMMRKLGRNWRRVHSSIYLASLLALLHYWWTVKSGDMEPALYTAIILLLLAFRLFTWSGILSKKPGDDGMPVPER